MEVDSFSRLYILWLEAIAIRLEAIASRMEEAISSRLEAIAIYLLSFSNSQVFYFHVMCSSECISLCRWSGPQPTQLARMVKPAAEPVLAPAPPHGRSNFEGWEWVAPTTKGKRCLSISINLILEPQKLFDVLVLRQSGSVQVS